MHSFSIVFLTFFFALELSSAQHDPRLSNSITTRANNESYVGIADYHDLEEDDLDDEADYLLPSVPSLAEENSKTERRSLHLLTPERCQKHPKICDGIKAAMARIGTGGGPGMGLSRR